MVAMSIAVPGHGTPPHKGPQYHVYLNGEWSGSMPELKAAQALAELQLWPPQTRLAPSETLINLGLLRDPAKRSARR
jgi:hypothetical protein